MTPPASGAVIPLMSKSQGIAAASKAWLDVWTDSRVTHGEARLAMRLFLYVDGKRFQQTGQLLSYPGWDLLQEKTTLHRSSVARGLASLERHGAIKIVHGRFDPKTGRRRPNQYLLIPPNQVAPTRPGNPVTRSQNQVAKPGRARSTINGEVVNGESINIEDPNLTLKGSEESGRAREEGSPNSPSDNQPFLPSLNGASRPAAAGGNGAGADAVFIKYETREADLHERFMFRATGKPFLRYGRASGFYVSRTEQEAVRALAAAEGAL